MGIKLKPCPFCGGKAEIREYACNEFNVEIDHKDGCYLEEYSSYLDCFEEEKAAIVAAWNARSEKTCTVTQDFKCSECGNRIGAVRNCEQYTTVDGLKAWMSLDREVCDIPNYCPHRGCKVIME